MVDFTKLRQPKAQALPTDPFQVFKRLPKPPHINDLWESQSKALAEWNARRSERDMVIKLNTGGGKTLVGLLIAQSLLNELREPVLYLCANTQLVQQTIEKASEVGLTALPYTRGAELSADFLNSSKILVASYHALFNGLSRFGVRGSGKEAIRVGGIICDDAHTAFATLRDIFTISVSRKDQTELYSDLTARFRSAFQEIGRIGSFDDIVQRQDPGVLEVPYWAWRTNANAIRELLAREHVESYKFQMPLLRDHFDICHALVSSRDFAITSFHPITGLLPTFEDCSRRIYMSATIADDSSIIRTFNASAQAALAPIAPPSLAGVGERMILIPALMSLGKHSPTNVIKAIASKCSKHWGVVILAPSEVAASNWEDTAQFVLGDDVGDAVRALTEGKSKGPFVFANRYDGIDLIGNACRLLVMDGLPRGTNTYDLFRAEVLQGNSSITVGLAQRIEQGLGRGTRGAGDYCAVFLTGRDLVSWITRSDGLNLMTSSTKAQVLMGHEISRAIASGNDVLNAVNQCLKRDPTWTKYHAETLADLTEASKVDKHSIESAVAERAYLRFFEAREFERAISAVRKLADDGTIDKRYRGWLLQLAARAAHYWENARLSEQLQRHAFLSNNLIAPPKAAVPYEPVVEVGEQTENILRGISRFALRRGYLEDFDEAVSLLTASATSNQFEESMKQLGEFMGFRGQRPEKEYRVGPDVLWLNGKNLGFVIECKSRKDPKNPLVKEEHGQLLISGEWFRQQYQKRDAIRVVVHPNDMSTVPAAAQDTFVLTFRDLAHLVTILRGVLEELCSAQTETSMLEKRCATLLKENNLTSGQIVEKFLRKFRV